MRVGAADAVDDGVGAAGELAVVESPMAMVPVARRTARASSPGATTVSAPSALASGRWCGVLGGGEDRCRRRPKRRRAAMVSRPRVPAPSTTTVSPGRTPAASAACTAQAVGSTRTAASSVRSSGTACELARVGDHAAWTSRRRCRSRSRVCRPGSRCAEGDALAVVEVARRRTACARRVDAAGDAAEHRASSTTRRAVVEVADDLVAGRERERHDRLEVARASGRRWWRGREPQMPGEAGPDPHPAGAGQLGRVDVAQRAAGRPWRRRRRREAPGDAWRRRSGARLALEDAAPSSPDALAGRRPWPTGRPPRAAAARGRWAGAVRGRPAALSKCSTSQPRLRARAARRVSGLTATGKPTASSMGRSEVESA